MTYYEDNKERLLKKSNDYYRLNKNKALKQRKIYYQLNKEKCLKSCKDIYERIRIEKNKQRKDRYIHYKQLLVDYKGGKCSVCGYNKCLRALTFHHCKGDKLFTISQEIGKYSSQKQINKSVIDMLKLEADKCILVCFNCHMEIHDNEGD